MEQSNHRLNSAKNGMVIPGTFGAGRHLPETAVHQQPRREALQKLFRTVLTRLSDTGRIKGVPRWLLKSLLEV